MKLKVDNDLVRRNVELFKLILKRSSQQTTSSRELEGKIFQAFIHKVTGELRFNDVSPELSLEELRVWRPLSFRVFTSEERGGKLECELIEASLIQPQGALNQEAIKNLEQTIKTVKLISQILPRIQNLPRLFVEFSSVSLELSSFPHGGKDIIHDAWHQIDRLQTEDLLKGRETGTYLFRKDEYAKLLEEQLMHAHQKDIKCVTLSFLDSESKVKDTTVVKTDMGWLVYNDDPNLLEPTYPDMDSFLDNMKDTLKSPLLH